MSMVGVLFVVQVAMRQRKKAIDASDTAAQARAETTLNALKSDWLTTSWAVWQAAGYPTIE
jgi:hypothetical protein